MLPWSSLLSPLSIMAVHTSATIRNIALLLPPTFSTLPSIYVDIHHFQCTTIGHNHLPSAMSTDNGGGWRISWKMSGRLHPPSSASKKTCTPLMWLKRKLSRLTASAQVLIISETGIITCISRLLDVFTTCADRGCLRSKILSSS